MRAYAKLRRLTQRREEDLGETFTRLGDALRNSGRSGRVQCTILGPGEPRRWTLEVGERESRVKGEGTNAPDLEIITRETTWWDIADGSLSPLDAFRSGKLRILGDTNLGSHLLKLAGDGKGAASICRE